VTGHNGKPTRRAFLGQAAAGLAAAAALPQPAAASWLELRRVAAVLGSSRADEPFWELVKAQFALKPGLAMMNAANLCPSPRVVSDMVSALTRDIDADASFHNRAKFSALQTASLAALARYLGVQPDELVLTRNTSEANNTVITAQDLRAGDEVVIWDQNHPTNNVAWDVRAERHGFTVRKVATPAQPGSEDELAAPFLDALGPRTRVLAVTHISNTTGIRLPVARLCTAARERGIRTLVDGAQAVGVLQLDLHALGCDFYTTSAHKWFMGPKEVGVLYIRRELAGSLWPPVVGVGWEGARNQGARRLSTLGQRDDAAVAAMAAAVEFHEGIGAARIEARVLELAAALKQKLTERIPDIEFRTPRAAALSGGVVIFNVPGLAARPAYDALYQKHNIAGATSGAGLRLCPHIYTTLADVERAANAVAEVRSGRPLPDRPEHDVEQEAS
jgi:selenocysteine lyase/cysteine desulfurase